MSESCVSYFSILESTRYSSKFAKDEAESHSSQNGKFYIGRCMGQNLNHSLNLLTSAEVSSFSLKTLLGKSQPQKRADRPQIC
jgi:hypothetical protein